MQEIINNFSKLIYEGYNYENLINAEKSLEKLKFIICDKCKGTGCNKEICKDCDGTGIHIGKLRSINKVGF